MFFVYFQLFSPPGRLRLLSLFVICEAVKYLIDYEEMTIAPKSNRWWWWWWRSSSSGLWAHLPFVSLFNIFVINKNLLKRIFNGCKSLENHLNVFFYNFVEQQCFFMSNKSATMLNVNFMVLSAGVSGGIEWMFKLYKWEYQL